MILAFPDDPRFMIPFHIGSGDSNTGPRLGGRAPAIIRSLTITHGIYFATIPVTTTPALEASIFIDEARFAAFDALTNCIKPAGFECVEVIISEPSCRSEHIHLAGPLSEHPLILGSVSQDTDIEAEEPCPRSLHKLGGTPYLIQLRPNLISQIETCHSAGFRLVAQFEYIDPNDAPWQGTWPFADGLFQVFGRPPFHRNDWVWCWQY